MWLNVNKTKAILASGVMQWSCGTPRCIVQGHTCCFFTPFLLLPVSSTGKYIRLRATSQSNILACRRKQAGAKKNSFWNEVIANILNKLCGCRCLSLSQVVIGFLKEEMDLVNYIIILGKNFLWTCRCKNIKPSFIHLKRILLDKYETEKYIAFKQTKMNMFNKKWKPFEELILF